MCALHGCHPAQNGTLHKGCAHLPSVKRLHLSLPALHLHVSAPQASLAASNGSGGGGGPKKRLGDAVGWFKGLGQAATSMVGAGGSRAADAAEDPEYIKVCWFAANCLENPCKDVAHQCAALPCGTGWPSSW